MTSAGYLSFPHLHDELIAFVAEDDVWLGPVAGGRARRVSADQAQASHPRFARDGTMIAWTGRRDGAPEVYLAGVDGGNVRRVSFLGDPQTRVCGWTPAGEILALTASGQPFSHFTWAYAIPAGTPDAYLPASAVAGHQAGATAGAGAGAGAGLWPAGARRLPYGPVGDLAIEAGAVALLTSSGGRDPATWKRYRGGMTGRLWVAGETGAQTPAGPFTRILGDLAGQVASPMLTGGRLAMCAASEAGTPWARSPLARVRGRVDASPAIISEKKMPIDSDMPEFWNVARMPDAAPRSLAGTLLMMAEVFGEANRPDPIPLQKISNAKVQYGKSTGRKSSPVKAQAVISSPEVANSRCP